MLRLLVSKRSAASVPRAAMSCASVSPVARSVWFTVSTRAVSVSTTCEPVSLMARVTSRAPVARPSARAAPVRSSEEAISRARPSSRVDRLSLAPDSLSLTSPEVT